MKLIDGTYHVVLNGIRHWYRVAGAAHATPPLVIVHGGPGGNVYNFERTIGPYLEQFTTVVYAEQRGCGRSDAPADASDYAIPTLVSDLDVLRQVIMAERINLLGFSFGGELALEYAATYPAAVDKLIVQAPGVSLPGRCAWVQLYGFRQLGDDSIRTLIDTLLREGCDPDVALRQVWQQVDRATVDRFLFHQPAVAMLNRRLWDESGLINTGAMVRALAMAAPRPCLYDRLPVITTPTLVCVGLYDRNSGVDVNRDVASSLPCGQFMLFPESAHFRDMEETVSYAAMVQRFLVG